MTRIIWATWISRSPAPRDGVTALQMDIKVEGITPEIMRVALDAGASRPAAHPRARWTNHQRAAREDVRVGTSIITLKIDPEKIRDVIGKGGAVIRQITEETGTTIDIENDGTVKIASVSGAAGREAQRRIELITADVEVGRIYEGKVVKLMDFGAFVTILPGRDGLVHISQISDERVERVSDKLKEGDQMRVKVLEVDRQGRIRLSMRNVDADRVSNALPAALGSGRCRRSRPSSGCGRSLPARCASADSSDAPDGWQRRPARRPAGFWLRNSRRLCSR